MLNFELMKSPLNWLIILLMVVSAAFAIEVVKSAVTVTAKSLNNNSEG